MGLRFFLEITQAKTMPYQLQDVRVVYPGVPDWKGKALDQKAGEGFRIAQGHSS
jgi:hypothetical protein